MSNLGIVVPFWNLFDDADRLSHLRRCLEQLRDADVQVLCVELACGSESGCADVVLQADLESTFVWQKERLVNHGCSTLADRGAHYVGYVDGDCLFADSSWVERIVDEFDNGSHIVQGYDRAVVEDGSVPAALASYPQLGPQLHGGCMFLRSDIYHEIQGFYEYCIVGGGDFVFAMAATGDLTSVSTVFQCASYREHAMRWIEHVMAQELSVSCADNAVHILKHGNPQRSRRLRHALLQDFEPEEDILRDDVLHLTETGKRLLPRLRAYSAHRENRADIITNNESSQ